MPLATGGGLRVSGPLPRTASRRRDALLRQHWDHGLVTLQPTLFLMVGLPAAGKSTVAREIESTHRALRLSPDEWMIPLFGESDADGRRDLLEGLLIDVAVRALHLGMNVILDFGLWGRDERTALRTLGEAAGAHVVLRYVDVDEEAQARRIGERWAADPEATFPMSLTDLVRWRAQFEVPTPDELAGSYLDEPPSGSSWAEWARTRWPSLR